MGLGVVHVGGISGGVCLEDADDLTAYAEVFDQLRAFALSPAQSALLLREVWSATNKIQGRCPGKGGAPALAFGPPVRSSPLSAGSR